MPFINDEQIIASSHLYVNTFSLLMNG